MPTRVADRASRLALLALLLVVFQIAAGQDFRSKQYNVAQIDPDASRNFTDVVTSKGYPCEEHKVVTPDGYILGVFRIPFGKNGNFKNQPRQPVLLQHGLLDSSFTWILNFPEQSLAYILADAGFDVWLGNVRGNRYSDQGASKETDYWFYSWDDHALIDLPTTIDYVRNATGYAKINYVGHSQGTTTMFALLSENPGFAAQHLNVFVALAPVTSVTSIQVGFLNNMAKYYLDDLFALMGLKRFLPMPPLIVRILGEDLCERDPIVCNNLIELLCGQHQGAFNDSRLPVVTGQYPGGTSTMNIMHWAQWMRSNSWQRFDWGSAALNIKHYNQTTPPKYNIANYPKDFPTAIFYGGADALADPVDVKILLSELPAPPVLVRYLPEYAHLDFTWGIEANVDFYPDVVALLNKYGPPNSRR